MTRLIYIYIYTFTLNSILSKIHVLQTPNTGYHIKIFFAHDGIKHRSLDSACNWRFKILASCRSCNNFSSNSSIILSKRGALPRLDGVAASISSAQLHLLKKSCNNIFMLFLSFLGYKEKRRVGINSAHVKLFT